MGSSWVKVVKWLTTVRYLNFKKDIWDNSEKNYLLALVSDVLNTKKFKEPLLNEVTAAPQHWCVRLDIRAQQLSFVAIANV